MTLKILLLSTLALGCLAAGCSSRNEQTRSSVTSDVQVAAPTSDGEPLVQPDTTAPEGKPAGDSSEVVTSRDEMGNVIETRTFSSNTYLDKIVVKTYVDGSKIGSVFGKDGEKLPLTDAHIAIAHGVDGDEFAEIVGLKKSIQTANAGTAPGPAPETIELPNFSGARSAPAQQDGASNLPEKERAIEASKDLDSKQAAALQNELRHMQLPRPKN